jgi:iron complex outermembrane receptor protein
MPYANEMASNGVHHGTFRHEQGNASLQKETGLHLDGSLRYHAARHWAEMALWGSAYQGFIYLGPSGKFSYLPEAGQVYAYYQDNAWIWGGEVEHEIELLKYLVLRQGAEAVFSQVGTTGRSLPFSPPFALFHRLEWKKVYGQRINQISLWCLVDQVLAQQRTARNEPATPGYILVHLGLGGRLAFRSLGFLHWSMRVNNLFNTPYLNHMSRYRALNLPEQGRNFLLGLHMPLSMGKRNPTPGEK